MHIYLCWQACIHIYIYMDCGSIYGIILILSLKKESHHWYDLLLSFKEGIVQLFYESWVLSELYHLIIDCWFGKVYIFKFGPRDDLDVFLIYFLIDESEVRALNLLMISRGFWVARGICSGFYFSSWATHSIASSHSAWYLPFYIYIACIDILSSIIYIVPRWPGIFCMQMFLSWLFILYIIS